MFESFYLKVERLKIEAKYFGFVSWRNVFAEGI
jgi:hypothetical protein